MPAQAEPRHPQATPELRCTIAEASLSLALLDAERLEELAIEFEKLHTHSPSMPPAKWAELAHQLRCATREMAIFTRVLEATRANLTVMHRLPGLLHGCCEYDLPQRSSLEGIHGND